eukprot:TRINITY_DN5309_c0_g1_i14.p1 TRINITY_DN5309_c0_g1~~TRINITY_DN5309_c0_g1_i14.p1  ORF type:complete len:202 (-),score=3.41 TRINITY_DN5309_c0_g1_i14:139-744(-)
MQAIHSYFPRYLCSFPFAHAADSTLDTEVTMEDATVEEATALAANSTPQFKLSPIESSGSCSMKVKTLRDIEEDCAMEKGEARRGCCGCKRTMCLEAKCECFLTGRPCEGCGCAYCCNIGTSEFPNRNNIEERGCRMILNEGLGGIRKRCKVGTRCNCGRGGCRKRLCECALLGASCGQSCNCQGCNNVKIKKHKFDIKTK